MPRPFTDTETVREHLLDILEDLIAERGGDVMTLTELSVAAAMSTTNIHRYFANQEALFEALAERWFAPKIKIMEDVIASDLPIEQKLYAFFARRFVLTRKDYLRDPKLYEYYMELGDQHFEIVRGYIDLADHYLAILVAEAIGAGYFEGKTVDQAVSLVNLMIHPFVNPELMLEFERSMTEDKLATIIGTILRGLSARSADIVGTQIVPIGAARSTS